MPGFIRARAGNILKKLAGRGEALPDFAGELDRGALERQLADEGLWQALLAASKAEWAIERAAGSGEPAHCARYAFQLAQAFSNFYHDYPVLHETDHERRVFLLWLTDYFRRQLERTLDVLGIVTPRYM